jgi:hypothetical protein
MRLIRQLPEIEPPFTSLSRYSGYPEFEGSFEIQINPASLRIGTYRTFGAGDSMRLQIKSAFCGTV